MELVIKSVVLGLTSVLLALTIRKNAPETGLLLTVAAVGAIAVLAAEPISGILTQFKQLAEHSGLTSTVFEPVIKTMGIGIVTKISSAVCKDAGESALANTIELVGCIAAVAAAIPLMRSVLEIVLSFL